MNAQTPNRVAGKLSLVALGLFVASLFMVWSNPDGVTRGPFVADFTEPGMLILPALGVIGAFVGTVFGLSRMGRGLGITVLVLGTLNLLAMTALMVAAGFSAVREGLALLELASLLVMASGAIGTFRPAPKPGESSSPSTASGSLPIAA